MSKRRESQFELDWDMSSSFICWAILLAISPTVTWTVNDMTWFSGSLTLVFALLLLGSLALGGFTLDVYYKGRRVFAYHKLSTTLASYSMKLARRRLGSAR
jgi:hypothetical protein